MNALSPLRALSTEPLVVFAAVAAAIFLWDLSSDEAEASADHASTGDDELLRIHIPLQVSEALSEEYLWREGVLPDSATAEALIEEWVDDEILFRSALLEGMHLNDARMREHLIEKMHLLWTGVADEPTDAQLVAFYGENMDRYRAEPRASFEHVFYENQPDDAAAILALLRSGEAIEGDDFWLGKDLNEYAESILRNTFGGQFYGRLFAAQTGEWFGPLESPRGHHFVRVRSTTPSAPLPYAAVHDRVRRDWQTHQMREQVGAHVRELREEFTVTVESARE